MHGAEIWLTVPIEDVVVQFTLLITAALFVQLTVERLALPGLIGLLIIGAVLGPGATGILPREPVVELLGQIGLVYLLFLAGVEIDLDEAQRHGRETVVFGILALLCPAVPAVAVGFVWGYPWPNAVLLGTLIASHTLLAYPIVARFGLQHRTAVITSVGGTLITDTIALMVLAVVIQLAGTPSDGGAPWWLPLLLLAGIVVVALLAVPPASRWFLTRAAVRPAEKALYILVVLLVLAAAAELVGTEPILGAFLAGLCLNRVLLEHRELWEHIEFMGRMLLLPFFYISTGMLLEVDALTTSGQIWVLAGVLVGLVLTGKVTAAWLTGWLFAYPGADRRLMVGLTLPQAAATLAIAVTAHRAGLFDRAIVDAVIVLIFATCMAGPLIVGWAARAHHRSSRDAAAGSQNGSRHRPA